MLARLVVIVYDRACAGTSSLWTPPLPIILEDQTGSGPRDEDVSLIILRLLPITIDGDFIVTFSGLRGLYSPWQQNSPQQSLTLKATCSWYTLHVVRNKIAAYTDTICRTNHSSVYPTNSPAKISRPFKRTSKEKTKTYSSP